MERIDLKLFLRYSTIFVFFACGLFILLDSFVFDNPVFDVNSDEKQSVNWDYLSDREKRNKVKMKESYKDLMAIGSIYLKYTNWELAIENFYWAKTLFPDRIQPRKNLCYSYFMMCQEDSRYCNKGKRELYYAMKYVDPTDLTTYSYLNNLVDLVGLEEVVELDEGEALALLY